MISFNVSLTWSWPEWQAVVDREAMPHFTAGSILPVIADASLHSLLRHLRVSHQAKRAWA